MVPSVAPDPTVTTATTPPAAQIIGQSLLQLDPYDTVFVIVLKKFLHKLSWL